MTPANIAAMAMLAGIDVGAVSDHNSTRNCPAFLEAAEKAGILAVPAMELTTAEEAHILCLLPSLAAAEELDRYVYARLPPVKNRADVFGKQLMMDAEDGVIGQEPHLLITATSIGVHDVAGLLNDLGGIAIPAHIDRTSFSILSNLGFITKEMGFEALETTRGADFDALAAAQAEVRGMPVIINSDAHRLDDIFDAEFELEADEISAEGVIEAIRKGNALKRL
ncbi:MAG: PHP domain-containing protein [Peptococcaceae bacterium]|jgi:predicted metal-dependent phosphoesterase TrpH|nr:PHP domain-containing protein [Peptococcaceae bacterium]